MEQIEGNIIDIFHRRIYPGIIFLKEGTIVSVQPNTNRYSHYISPGFIDAHVHIESSMLTPKEFSRLAIRRGTIAVVTDPHEIGNVLGVHGVLFMQENSQEALIRSFFTAPSCVPATPLDVSGASISAEEVEKLLSQGNFVGLSEMMNVPGVLNQDPEVMAKIESAKSRNLCIDGHAPGLSGIDLKRYVSYGISTDHECTTYEEAVEKIEAGMKILIREGSAAKNYESLKELIRHYPDRVMFCTDDSHPGDLLKEGEIDKLVRKAIQDGYDLFDVLKIATQNPAVHYHLDVGNLLPGSKADFVVFEDLKRFVPLAVYIEGEKRYERKGEEEFYYFPKDKIISGKQRNEENYNLFLRGEIRKKDIEKRVASSLVSIRIIPGELITQKEIIGIQGENRNFESDTEKDILKIVYLNRYQTGSIPQIGYIRGIGLKKGAFATSISHDSHNILAVGCTDSEIVQAINAIIHEKGGLSVVSGEKTEILPLPLAGIMSNESGKQVAAQWEKLLGLLREMGTKLESPFMTLSFMSLIVIPELKIGEKGLFEYSSFRFISN